MSRRAEVGLCECGCGQPTEPCRQTRSDRGYRRGEPQRYLAGHRGLDVARDESRALAAASARFWDKADTGGGPDSCWLWSGSKTGDGYGAVNLGGKKARAHRVAYLLANGPIPPGLCVCHRCDVRLCVNPAHLFVGTAQDNIADMVAKGRHAMSVQRFGRLDPQYQVRGAASPFAKLSEADVVAIRERHQSGERQVAIARDLGVDPSLISMIVNRKAWSHVA